MKVDPKWIVLILMVFGGLLLAQYWTGSQWRSMQGPDLLVKDQQGNLYIGLHSKILRYSPSGKFLDQRDLNVLGIETRIGGMAFFPNGDFLMVPKIYQPSLMQQFLIAYRITPPIPHRDQDQSERLSRCVWETMVCTALPELAHQFNDAFWVDIDADENIFIADTSQHRLFWLDKEGREIDQFSSAAALQFPNQIKRQGDKLLIANCNDNSLSSIKLLQNKFAPSLERYPLVDERLAANDRWPIGVIIADDNYIVLAKGSNLMHGALVRMDKHGVIGDVFPSSINGIQPAADFIALAWFNDEILAADFASLTIKLFSQYGALNGEFDAPEFIAATAEYRQQMTAYQTWERYFSWVFWSLFIMGFVLALYLDKRHKREAVQTEMQHDANPHFAPHVSDKRIQWLAYKFFWRNINKWLIWFWAPLLLLIVPSLFSVEEESFLRNAGYLVLHGVLLLKMISAHRLTNRKLGALVPWVFLKHGKRVESAHEQNIHSFRWFGSVILMIEREDILVMQSGNRSLFEGALAQEYIVRLIELAQPLNFVERLLWLLENKLASMVWQGLLLLLYILALAVPLLH